MKTIDNPFENKSQIESIPKRTNRTGKKLNPRKRKRDKNKLHDDPEIGALMRIYGDRVTVVQDSDP